MADAIEVAPGIVIPAEAIAMKAVRSSGPGGQNVNKVASKVELRVDLSLVQGLEDGARARLDAATRQKRDAAGLLLVASQRTRDQHRNLEDAREKVREIVAASVPEPRRRRASRPTAASRERRLQGKREASLRKRTRGTVRGED
jgi:ribosome-associated protein